MTDELLARSRAPPPRPSSRISICPTSRSAAPSAEIARERGLGPLAEAILADRALEPAELAEAYITAEVADVKTALEGARDIVAEGIRRKCRPARQMRAYICAAPPSC
jgi:uncharacterized protein